MNLHLVDAALPLSPPRAVLHGYRRVPRAGGDVGEWPELLGPVSVALEIRGWVPWVGYAPTAHRFAVRYRTVCFYGDRTIPIHARTLGVSVLPQEMDVYDTYTVRFYSLQCCTPHTITRPPLERTHTSINPAFPSTGGGWGVGASSGRTCQDLG